jgi:hypothetical protein
VPVDPLKFFRSCPISLFKGSLAVRIREWSNAFVFCLGVIALLSVAVPTGAIQPDDHVSITIHSKWVGLGGAKESVATVMQLRGQCYVNGKVVESKLVEDLLRELAAPAEAPSLANIGIDQTWLDKNAGPAYAGHANDRPKVDKGKFLASYRNLSLVESLTPNLLREGWTDDYPTIEVKIQKGNDAPIVLTSKHQNVFMIPFDISQGKTARTSYNAKLAQAIVALLPANFTNRDRLGGNNLRSLVADKVIEKTRNS